MEEDMIKHAAESFFNIAYEVGWARYKLKHPCALSCTELLNKFWNEIRPNLKDYNCVKSDPTLLSMMEYIPSPTELREAAELQPMGIETKKFHTKAFPQAYKEEAARETSMRLADLDVLAIRNAAYTAISNFRSENETTQGASGRSSRHSAGTPDASNNTETLPDVGNSLPNNN